ncbi:head GIN domain-containing protein [Aurantiacibacter aquimixticola]|uniref:DUF2807 domain-containing protein n=1 Tax=Aurantiacibacter aquimixticola TaxID=1958945 RepID=A0A419RUW8_9SPHN|nr:head GIN domain-containing protein [Aurantiacibacter aquimixticola]RJY09587.1 DUF2807 domain-containing protein [Aurantiacibacter aquimixticola]
MKIATIATSILAATALSACGMSYSNGTADGVPLAELDTNGAAPSHIGLSGPDNVVIMDGAQFAVDVDGPADVVDGLRFDRSGDRLTIGRGGSNLSMGDRATVTITMPAPSGLSLSGSGEIITQALASDASIASSGSGTVTAENIDVDALDIRVSGSGTIVAGGSARDLTVAISGSSDLEMDNLEVEDADIRISGSGDVAFASDGRVSASISGSGDVRVNGDAECEESIAGSGSLTCG